VTPGLATSPWTIWGITAAATAGVILRPFAWPEFIWAVTGAAALLALVGNRPLEQHHRFVQVPLRAVEFGNALQRIHHTGNIAVMLKVVQRALPVR